MNRAFLSLVTLLAFAASCAPSLNLPPPPDVEPGLRAFSNPTAEVTADIMQTVADVIEETRDDIETSEFFREVFDLVVNVQQELDGAIENGNLDIGGGVGFPSPNGGVSVDFTCPGWNRPPDDPPDPANGSIVLTLTLGGGSIGPLVWGEVIECRFDVEIADSSFDVSYDGTIALHLGRVVELNEELNLLPITYFSSGTVTVEDESFPINQAFRVTLDDQDVRRLSILVRLNDDKTFIYFFDREDGQGIIDANGQFGCNLEERRCDAFSW